MNKTKTSIVKRVALASAMLIGCAAVAPAFAGHVSLNIGVGLPVVGGYYAPAPVVYAPPPPPVYYAPAPVYYAPAPVVYPAAVGATVVVGGRPGYYHRGGYYYRGGYRYYGH
ncbi:MULTISPECIES: hypothetical protein [unclassified Dyella]|uniref:hypothetical protein n=1 Tax=unclassified Dyella TaxID=2634549 RepID=UPI000C821852|nr:MULTISPECIES: hypothetical protein [unclassified Dyella]MDR3445922.1 hypothetical protein [Dyella sp.]PMQ02863.1 hypothetical protein DyAD56_22290 [Dyella sp. AD56]